MLLLTIGRKKSGGGSSIRKLWCSTTPAWQSRTAEPTQHIYPNSFLYAIYDLLKYSTNSGFSSTILWTPNGKGLIVGDRKGLIDKNLLPKFCEWIISSNFYSFSSCKSHILPYLRSQNDQVLFVYRMWDWIFCNLPSCLTVSLTIPHVIMYDRIEMLRLKTKFMQSNRSLVPARILWSTTHTRVVQAPMAPYRVHTCPGWFWN